jgi:hypothetical protein
MHQVSIKIENLEQNEKKPSLPESTTTDILKTETTDDDEKCKDMDNHIDTEPKNFGAKSKPDEKKIESVRQIVCPICKSTVFQSELEYHMKMHVLAIEKNNPKISKPTNKFPYIELPPSKDGKKRVQCQFEGCGAKLKYNIKTHMVRMDSSICTEYNLSLCFLRPNTFQS